MKYAHDDAFYRQTAREIGQDHADRAPASAGTNPVNAKPARVVRLTPASSIKPRRVRWSWQERLALGSLALLAGREGIGKSLLAYTLIAQITRGTLQGEYYSTPRAAIVAATEDSWEHTIVPRLSVAGADLSRVFRVDVATADLGDTELSLPRDLPDLEPRVIEVAAAIIVLDPMMSRLDVALDTHKDGEVRRALEPLVTLADRTGTTVLGIIHVNKSGTSDPLTSIMGSRAFAAVARSVLFVMTDPDDEQTRLLGTPKNNLGRSDLPTLSFRIEGAKLTDPDDGDIWTGKLTWTGETSRTITEALQAAAENVGDKTSTSEAADWLQDYLASQDGSTDSAVAKREAAKAGHNLSAVQRARQCLGVTTITAGFPRRSVWSLPASVVSRPGETEINEMNETTGTTESQSFQSFHSSQSFRSPKPVS